MTSIEKNLALVLQNQITQAELLQILLNTHYGSSSMLIDDNKKGDRVGELKGLQIKKKGQHIRSH